MGRESVIIGVYLKLYSEAFVQEVSRHEWVNGYGWSVLSEVRGALFTC